MPHTQKGEVHDRADLALAGPDDIEWIKRFGLRGILTLPVRTNAGRVRKAA